MVKLYRVPEEPKIEGIREFKTKDIPQVTKLLSEYLYKISQKQSNILELSLKFILDLLKKKLSIGFYLERM